MSECSEPRRSGDPTTLAAAVGAVPEPGGRTRSAHHAPARRRSAKRILVAGIGNVFLQDDGFGPEVVRRLQERALPPGVRVFDFGTGGLNLAYETMRGYDALVLVDASRQGGEPGTLYVIEPDPADLDAPPPEGSERDPLDPHAMDPMSVLRFVKSVVGWPGPVRIVACEPQAWYDVGLGLTPVIAEASERAVALVEQTVRELQGGGPGGMVSDEES